MSERHKLLASHLSMSGHVHRLVHPRILVLTIPVQPGPHELGEARHVLGWDRRGDLYVSVGEETFAHGGSEDGVLEHGKFYTMWPSREKVKNSRVI